MPLIFKSPVPPLLVVGVDFAALSDVLSAHDFLLTSSPSLFTPNFKSALSFQRSFGGKPSSARNRSHLLCLLFYVICLIGNCSWFTARKNVSQTVNKQISLSWRKHENGGKVYVTWKSKMLHGVTLHDVISGHEAYIFMVIKNDR